MSRQQASRWCRSSPRHEAMVNWQDKIGETFDIRVTPKSSSDRIKAELQADGTLLINVYVTSVPEDGKANKSVIKLLAKELGVAKSALEIISGLKSRQKRVRLSRS